MKGLPVNEKERLAKVRGWFLVNGITQRELAEELGISPARMGKILKGYYPTESALQLLRRKGMPEELLPKTAEKGGKDETKKKQG
jgi:transcriptional regulator with XRE-family HTH domain